MNDFIAHILVVDDDDGIRSLVKQYLNENNFLVTTANSSENAEEKVLFIKFDLIVLDIMMAGKSGLEFIKDNKSKIDTPIILLTAKGEAEDRVGGLEIGADDYLSKPSTLSAVFSLAVKRIIGVSIIILFSLIKSKPLLPCIITSNTIKSNLIIETFSKASSALLEVVTKNLFSFRYCLTRDLIPSSSSTTKI